MRTRRRWFLWAGLSACLATSLAASASSVSASKPAEVRAGTVSVWVDLDLPALAEVPASDRAALRANILAQQAQVMLGLQALGAQEVARVQQVRNAVAVRLDASQMAAARALPGVRLVRIARDIERSPPVEKLRN
jgi:protein-disulfide isomerase